MNQATTFETTYIRYPFAPLVELGMALASLLKGGHGADKSGNVSGALGHAA